VSQRWDMQKTGVPYYHLLSSLFLPSYGEYIPRRRPNVLIFYRSIFTASPADTDLL
jgi:hypothetical protein